MKTYKPLLFFAGILLVVGLACSALGGGDTPTQAPVQQPTNPPVVAPTKEPLPTQEEPTQPPAPADTPVPARSEFFTEEFDSDPGSDWLMDIIGPGAEAHADSVETEFTNGRMRVELPEEQLYLYYTFAGFTYTDVRIELRADNRGVNTNNVSLICRLSDDGWYEWSVGSGGDWYLYAVTDGYNLIANGGTNFLKQGKEVNEYAMECKDKVISMFINGQEIRLSPVTDNNYGLREGSVGFNISSLDITPVIVEVEWFKVSEPE